MINEMEKQVEKLDVGGLKGVVKELKGWYLKIWGVFRRGGAAVVQYKLD